MIFSVNYGFMETCQVCYDEDERRERALTEMGLRIVRFRNDEILKNLSMVVERIKELALT